MTNKPLKIIKLGIIIQKTIIKMKNSNKINEKVFKQNEVAGALWN